VQSSIRGIGNFLIFQALFLPVINISLLVSYVMYQQYFNNLSIQLEVGHFFDMVTYGWKLVWWLLDNGLSWIATGKGAPLVEIKNPAINAWYAACNLGFVLSLIGWTIATSDDKWGFIKSILVKVGTWVLLVYFLATLVFDKTFTKLPTSRTVEFVWEKSLSKGLVLNPTAPAPVEYGPSGKTTVRPTSPDATEQAGFNMMWVYLIGGIVLILALLWFFKFRKKGGGGQTTASASAETTEGSTEASQGGGGGESKQEAKKYGRDDYAVDLDQLRYELDMFVQFEKTPYFCHNTAPYQKRIDRMRWYLAQNESVLGDKFLEKDHHTKVERLQNFIRLNVTDIYSLRSISSSTETSNHGMLASLIGEIMSSAKLGFFLRSNDYGRVLTTLSQYVHGLAAEIKFQAEQIPAGNQDKNQLNLLAWQQLNQRYQMVAIWLQQLGDAYGKVHNFPIPQMPGTVQPPTAPSWISVQYTKNPKMVQKVAGGLLLLLIVVFFLFRSGGKQETKMTNETKGQAMAEVMPMIDSTVNFLCQGVMFDSIPVDFKNRANAVMKKWDVSSTTFKAQVEKTYNKNCPPGKKKKVK
jgi:uncharacterized integral membrane protein